MRTQLEHLSLLKIPLRLSCLLPCFICTVLLSYGRATPASPNRSRARGKFGPSDLMDAVRAFESIEAAIEDCKWFAFMQHNEGPRASLLRAAKSIRNGNFRAECVDQPSNSPYVWTELWGIAETTAQLIMKRLKAQGLEPVVTRTDYIAWLEARVQAEAAAADDAPVLGAGGRADASSAAAGASSSAASAAASPVRKRGRAGSAAGGSPSTASRRATPSSARSARSGQGGGSGGGSISGGSTTTTVSGHRFTHGSGSYAIVVALYRRRQLLGGPVRERALRAAAQAYCKEGTDLMEHLGQDEWRSAWSGMGTLLDKGIVREAGSPSGYELTDLGVEAGRVLDEVERTRADSAEARATSAASLFTGAGFGAAAGGSGGGGGSGSSSAAAASASGDSEEELPQPPRPPVATGGAGGGRPPRHPVVATSNGVIDFSLDDDDDDDEDDDEGGRGLRGPRAVRRRLSESRRVASRGASAASRGGDSGDDGDDGDDASDSDAPAASPAPQARTAASSAAAAVAAPPHAAAGASAVATPTGGASALPARHNSVIIVVDSSDDDSSSGNDDSGDSSGDDGDGAGRPTIQGRGHAGAAASSAAGGLGAGGVAEDDAGGSSADSSSGSSSDADDGKRTNGVSDDDSVLASGALGSESDAATASSAAASAPSRPVDVRPIAPMLQFWRQRGRRSAIGGAWYGRSLAAQPAPAPPPQRPYFAWPFGAAPRPAGVRPTEDAGGRVIAGLSAARLGYDMGRADALQLPSSPSSAASSAAAAPQHAATVAAAPPSHAPVPGARVWLIMDQWEPQHFRAAVAAQVSQLSAVAAGMGVSLGVITRQLPAGDYLWAAELPTPAASTSSSSSSPYYFDARASGAGAGGSSASGSTAASSSAAASSGDGGAGSSGAASGPPESRLRVLGLIAERKSVGTRCTCHRPTGR